MRRAIARFVDVARFAPLFVIGSATLMLMAAIPGALLLVEKTEFFKAEMFAGGLQLFVVLGFGGWFPVIEAVERIEAAWPSLDAVARSRARRFTKAAGLWVWGYCLIWAIWMPLYATDRLPYGNPAFWVAASALWLAGLWAALAIRRKTGEFLSASTPPDRAESASA